MTPSDKDKLGIFFGKPFQINSKISIRQPTIGEIVEYGEDRFFSLISCATAISSEYKSLLWDAGIDYEQIDDFCMFSWMMCRQDVDTTRILFGDLDFTKLKPVVREDGQTILRDPEQDIIIDFNIHRRIKEYFKDAYGIEKKPEKAANKQTKMKLIELDRMDKEDAAKQRHQSTLQPLISSLVNHPGFKYDLVGVLSLTFGQIMDAVQRLQIIQTAQSLMQGSMSGFCDTSKVPKQLWDWTRPLKK
jgi:hypothetical protein